jgi:radical SAM protein with 4Fe4S-binding SPASM domain
VAKFYEDRNFRVVPIHSDQEIKDIHQEHFSSKGAGYKCYVCKLWSCVGSDGCLYPCGHIAVDGTDNYGNLLEDSFMKIWNSRKRKEVSNSLPEKNCTICSPFSLRTNEFLTFASNAGVENFSEFYHKNFNLKKRVN